MTESVNIQGQYQLMVIVVARLRHVPNLKLPIMKQFLRALMLYLHRDARLRLLLRELDLLRINVNVLLLLALGGALAPVHRLRLDDHCYLLRVLSEWVPQLNGVELRQARRRQNDLLLTEQKQASVQILLHRLRLLVELLRRHQVRIRRPLIRE